MIYAYYVITNMPPMAILVRTIRRRVVRALKVGHPVTNSSFALDPISCSYAWFRVCVRIPVPIAGIMKTRVQKFSTGLQTLSNEDMTSWMTALYALQRNTSNSNSDL